MPKRELDVPETFGQFFLMDFGPDDFWKPLVFRQRNFFITLTRNLLAGPRKYGIADAPRPHQSGLNLSHPILQQLKKAAYPQTTSIFMEQLWDIGIGKYKILCVAEHITCYHLFWLVKISYRNPVHHNTLPE